MMKCVIPGSLLMSFENSACFLTKTHYYSVHNFCDEMSTQSSGTCSESVFFFMRAGRTDEFVDMNNNDDAGTINKVK